MAEITIDSTRDIGNRKIRKSQLSNFKGQIAQVVHNVDDKNRPLVMYGDRVGHYEEVVLKSDIGDFKNQLTEIVTGNKILDTDKYNLFNLSVNTDRAIFTLTNPDLSGIQTKTVKAVITNLRKNTVISFDNVKWLNGTPVLPSTINTGYVLSFYYTSTGWIGEYVRQIGNTIITSNNHSLTEWLLPAGSISGDEPEKITENYFMDISDSEKQIMSNISQNIKDINSISENLNSLTTIEDNLQILNSVNEHADSIKSVASSILKLTSIVNSLTNILEVQKYLANINLVANHIQDKYFLDVKVTDSHITGNTILQLDKIVLAPAEYKSTSEIDTDSSDGTITPSLLIYSDTEVQDAAVVDGTIVVTESSNKFNS